MIVSASNQGDICEGYCPGDFVGNHIVIGSSSTHRYNYHLPIYFFTN